MEIKIVCGILAVKKNEYHKNKVLKSLNSQFDFLFIFINHNFIG